MLTMKIDRMVAGLVRQELIEAKGKDGKALHFHFDLRMSYFTDDKSYDTSRALHLLYHLPYGYNSVDVFSAVLDSPFDGIRKVENWKHECSHDSCWRDVDVFPRVYFEMATKINEKLVEKGLEEVAPKEMHEFNSFALFGQVYDWVPVEVQRSQEYRKEIKILL